MDTLSGIEYRSEHIHGGYPCTLVDIYTEREGHIHYLGYMHGVVTIPVYVQMYNLR